MAIAKALYVSAVWLLTAVACIFEVFILTSDYMSYKTTTKWGIRHSVSMHVPTIVLCLETEYRGSNISYFFEKFVQPEKDPLYYISSICSNCRTANSTVYSYTKDVKKEVTKSGVMKVSKFMWNGGKCFAFRFHVHRFNRHLFTAILKPLIYKLTFFREQHGSFPFKYFMLSYSQSHTYLHSATFLIFFLQHKTFECRSKRLNLRR